MSNEFRCPVCDKMKKRGKFVKWRRSTIKVCSNCIKKENLKEGGVKMNKKELKEQLQSLLQVAYADREQSENAFLSNEVYSSHSDDWLELNESGRSLLSSKIVNEDYIIRRLIELIDKV